MELNRQQMDLATQNFEPMLIIGSIGILVIGSLVYGIYVTFGAGAENLTDQMEEHARLHKYGIAHSHSGNGKAVPKGNKVKNHSHDLPVKS